MRNFSSACKPSACETCVRLARFGFAPCRVAELQPLGYFFVIPFQMSSIYYVYSLLSTIYSSSTRAGN